MRIESRTHRNELPEIFRQMFVIAPQDLWRRRSNELTERERHNPFLGRYFDERYSTERMLSRVLTYRKSTGRYPRIRALQDHEIFKLYSFASALTRVYANLSSEAQARLRGAVRDGLNSEPGLAPVALEMSVATHLSNAGFDVDFADLEGHQRFDLLVRKEGIELEVDCKTASGDVGRSVHRRRALELFRRIQSALAEQVDQHGSRAIQILIADSLHGDNEYMSGLSDLVVQSVQGQQGLSAPGLGEVKLGPLEIGTGPFLRAGEPSEDELAQIVQNIFGTPDAHDISMHRPGAAAVVAVIQSKRPDKVLDGVYHQLKLSAQRQFSGRNPALLAVRLTDLTSPQLHELAADRANGLGAICNRLFAGQTRHHLYGVAFLAAAQPLTGFRFPGGQIFDERGAALLFRRYGHPSADDPRLDKLFSS
jgi:hypothetical protein